MDLLRRFAYPTSAWAFMVLSFDLTLMPFKLDWKLPTDGSILTGAHILLISWTLDMLIDLRNGCGLLEMRPAAVAMNVHEWQFQPCHGVQPARQQ